LANGGRPWREREKEALMGKGVEILGYFGKIFWEFGRKKKKRKRKEKEKRKRIDN